MRPLQYELSCSVIAFVILAVIWTHNKAHGKLEDQNNRLFRWLILFGTLDVALDFLSAVIPAIDSLHIPLLYTGINTCYNGINVLLCYTILYYTDSLRETPHEFPKYLKYFALLPCGISFFLLILNFPTKLVFFYDEAGVHYSGPLGRFVFVLAAVHIFAAVFIIIRYRQDYGKTRIRFLLNTFLLLGICILAQLFIPRLLSIDTGIALCLLSFYLHNNNPVQYMDTLTGALDKNYFDTWVKDQIRKEKKIFLIAVRVKNLHSINFVYGEKTGNQIVSDLAETLRKFDHEKTVFRLSGSCLMVHCHSMEAYCEELKALNSQFEEKHHQSYEEHGNVIRLIGIPNAETLLPERSINAYLEYLQLQMDQLKDSFLMESSEETLAGFRYETEIERYLREAIENDYFTLAYQPIYHLQKQRFVSVEVLSRLSHPTLGRLNPQNVIHIAEQNGLIDEVTQLQFEKLCRFMRANPEIVQRLDCFKFNLSPLNLADSEFIRSLIQIIDRFGLSSEKFEFELTESFATEQTKELAEIIRLCQERHISLSLDDFGSGYSNMSNVLQIPFKNVKLDRSLLLEVSKDPKIASFYEGIVHLMQSYGMEIICEGVETKEETDLLHVWGADMIQGYYYSKPLSEDDLCRVIKIPHDTDE